MIKVYHYRRCYNYGDDMEEYIVKAENEIEALKKIATLKSEKGDCYIIAHARCLKEISFEDNDIIDLC